MSDWQPNLYLAFERERTQPSIDLVRRIEQNAPKRIIDIGCGPGNSTKVLKSRWPDSEIIGLDNSASMLEQAKKIEGNIQWLCKSASEDLSGLGKFDIVFSNAAIQWIPDQNSLLSKLFQLLTDTGTLAVQVPCTQYMPLHTALQQLIKIPKWEGVFQSLSSTYSIHASGFYYDILSGLSDNIDLWETNYFHTMKSHYDMIQWYSSSGLRPYLACLTDEREKEAFLVEYEDLLKGAYPLQKNHKVLLPFTRIFFTVNKQA